MLAWSATVGGLAHAAQEAAPELGDVFVTATARPEDRSRIAVRLSQIVANLLLNAAKFSAPGGAVSISAARVGSEVHIRLSDNGIGIAAASIDRMITYSAMSSR